MIRSGPASEEQRMLSAALDAGIDAPRAAMWGYPAASVILGRGQRPDEALIERAAREGLEVVQRPSGGGAVLAGPWMCSHTVLLPPEHPISRLSLPASYEWLGRAWQRVLAQFGIETQLAQTGGRGRADSTVGWVCFAGVSFGELVAPGERKIVGLSQVRRRGGIAVCSGILLDRPDWARLLRTWLGHDEPAVERALVGCTATCEELAPAGRSPTAALLQAGIESEMAAMGIAA